MIILTTVLLFLVSTVHANNRTPTSTLVKPTYITEKFKVSPWVAECKDLKVGYPSRCGIQKALGESFDVEIEVPFLTEPGTAVVKRKVFSSKDKKNDLSPANTITAELSIFSVYPKATEKLAVPPYIQLQLELIAPNRMRCMQSVKLEQPLNMPPLICSHISDTVEVGLTLQQID